MDVLSKKRMIPLTALVVIVIALVSGFVMTSVSKGQYSVVIDTATIRSLDILRDDLLIVDLRDREDYERKHIAGAINLPYNDDGAFMLSYLSAKNKQNTEIYLMCYSGKRAGKAFNQLVENNFNNVHYVRFGFDAYEEALGTSGIFAEGECPCVDEE